MAEILGFSVNKQSRAHKSVNFVRLYGCGENTDV